MPKACGELQGGDLEASSYHQLIEQEEKHWWYLGRRQVLADVLRRLDLPTEARIFEAGCGTGGNLELLAGFGTVDALEVNDFARESVLARRKPVRQMFSDRLPDGLALGDRRYDLIAMLDVLEHLDDDLAVLQALRPHLAAGGRMLLTVPAYQWLWGPHDVLAHHRRRYTRRSLVAVLEQAGLRVRKCTYFNTLLFPLAIVARMLDHWRPPTDELTGATMPARPVNAVFRAVFASERFLLRALNLPFGLSILVWAELSEAAEPLREGVS
jgi:SAM-dependent methyltransferase